MLINVNYHVIFLHSYSFGVKCLLLLHCSCSLTVVIKELNITDCNSIILESVIK